MAKNLEVTISSNHKEFKKFLERATKRVLPTVVKQTLNRANKKQRSKFIDAFAKQRALPKKRIKKDVELHQVPRGQRDVGLMVATTTVSSRSIGMIHFVKGSKTPRKQKGISVKRRSKITVRVRQDGVRQDGSLFIARGKKKQKDSQGKAVYHLYKRKRKPGDKGKGKIVAQRVASLASVALKPEVHTSILRQTREFVPKEIIRLYNVRLNQLKPRKNKKKK